MRFTKHFNSKISSWILENPRLVEQVCSLSLVVITSIMTSSVDVMALDHIKLLQHQDVKTANGANIRSVSEQSAKADVILIVESKKNPDEVLQHELDKQDTMVHSAHLVYRVEGSRTKRRWWRVN